MSATSTPRLQIVRQHLVPSLRFDIAAPLDVLATSDTWAGQSLRSLIQRVGGAEQLAALDARPHADEPFDWSGIDPDDQARVARIVELIDSVCDAHLDTESRTIARRLLSKAMRNDPSRLHRCASDDRFAAAVVFAVLDGNDAVGSRQIVQIAPCRRLRSVDVFAWFGVTAVNDLACSISRAARVPRLALDGSAWSPRRFGLDDVPLLHSKCRAAMLVARDHVVPAVVEAERLEGRHRPRWRFDSAGEVEVHSTPTEFVFAKEGVDANGRRQVVLMLSVAGSYFHVDFFALSRTDAGLLHDYLGAVLDGQAPPDDAWEPTPRYR